MCAITVRHLKPDSYEAFCEAWRPNPWPDEVRRVVVCRNEQDPDQVLTATFFETTAVELDRARDDPHRLGAEEQRMRRIAEFEDAVVFKGLFTVADDLVL